MGARGSPCKVCEHPDRASIEMGSANKIPIRVLGKRYGLSPDSIFRHSKNHMSPQLHMQLMTRGRISPTDLENLREVESESLLQNAVVMRGRLYGLFDAAQDQGDLRTAASISANILKYQDFIARLLGDIHTGHVSLTQNVLVLPEFHALRTTIMQALRQHPEARASVAAALKAIESPDLPRQETEEEREAAAGEMAKGRDVTRRSRAKKQGQVIDGEATRV